MLFRCIPFLMPARAAGRRSGAPDAAGGRRRARAAAGLAVAALLLPGLAGAEVDRARAGQSVTEAVEDGGQRTREYASNGRLVYEVIERTGADGRVEAIEREWSADGVPLREQTFVGGREVTATYWYMNGKVKEKREDQSRREPGGPPGTWVERYSDRGVLQSSGVYQGFRPVGAHRRYDASGALELETVYDAHGVRLSETRYADGRRGATVEFHPDGSRRD